MPATFSPGFRPERDEIMARYWRKEVIVSILQTVSRYGKIFAGCPNNRSVVRAACRMTLFRTKRALVMVAGLSMNLAGAAGFEPATYGFGDRRSTS